MSIISQMSDERWTRADWARWFVDHDEVDEAARVLEPGDEVTLGRGDSLALAAALSRRGIPFSYELGRLVVRGDAAARRPPLRAVPPSASASKKTA